MAADSLPADPALVRGRLPNGLHYYVRANGMPAHRAELWLAVNAGSVLEDEDQRGLAHFLEHMAFNGTMHFPKHALIDYLENAGMRFGPDLNAYTSFDETVYQFTIPTDGPTFLAQGLQMLADLAGGGITIDSEEVLAERGVILGEWRSRLPDTASQKAQVHQDSVLYGGDSRYATRGPIGLPSIIEHAQPSPIRRFYHDWYRPDLMAVVVVGDVDPRAAERLIRAQFGTIGASPHRRTRVNYLLPSDAEPHFDLYRGRVVPAITLLWMEPHHSEDTPTGFRADLVNQLLFAGVQRDLLRMREQPRRPFFQATAGRTSLPARSVDVQFVRVVAWADSLESGLAAALAEFERAAREGVPTPVLERQKAGLLRQFESAAAAEAARPSTDYAHEYTTHYLRGDGALMSAAQELALARSILPTITQRDIAHAAAFWHRRSDLQVLVNLPTFAHARPPSRESVLALLDSVTRTPVPVDTSRVFADSPLMPALPTPGRIVRERRDPRSEVTEWTLSNGARVLVKPTRFNADELMLKAVSPGGFSLVPDSLFFTSGRLVAQMMTQAAGVGTLHRDVLSQKLATTVLRDFNVSITNNDESISLAASPKDLSTIFQLLYLQFTAPKLDTAALAGWKQAGTPGNFSVDDQLTYLLARGDPRRSPPPWSLIPFADVPRAMAVYRDRFGNASDFTFFIVGNATTTELRPLVERYVASLPGTGHHEAAKPLDVKPWKETVERTNRAFDIPKASTFLVFDGTFPSDPTHYVVERQRLATLGQVLQLRLRDLLRERLGGTYSVGVRTETYADPAEHYRVLLAFDAAPERIDSLQDVFFAVLDSVRGAGATASELAKAAAIGRRTHEVALQDNEYWLNRLELYDRLKIPFRQLVAPPTLAFTPADIRAAAQQYLPPQSFIHFTVLPTDSSYMTEDSTKP
jgi:zinc protease